MEEMKDLETEEILHHLHVVPMTQNDRRLGVMPSLFCAFLFLKL